MTNDEIEELIDDIRSGRNRTYKASLALLDIYESTRNKLEGFTGPDKPPPSRDDDPTWLKTLRGCWMVKKHANDIRNRNSREAELMGAFVRLLERYDAKRKELETSRRQAARYRDERDIARAKVADPRGASEPRRYETEAEQAGAGESFGGAEETWSGPPHALSDLELRAMTALLELEVDFPCPDVRKAVMVELVRRDAFAAVDAQSAGEKT